MRNFERDKTESTFKKILYSWPFLFLFATLVVFFAYGVVGFYGKARDTSTNRDIAESKMNELKERRTTLESDIAELETDAGKEKVFRESFGYGKEGEKLIVIVKDEKAEEAKNVQTSWFRAILDWFR